MIQFDKEVPLYIQKRVQLLQNIVEDQPAGFKLIINPKSPELPHEVTFNRDVIPYWFGSQWPFWLPQQKRSILYCCNYAYQRLKDLEKIKDS